MEENKRKIWTIEEIKLLENNYSNMFNSDLVKLFNRTEQSIYLKANKLGLKKSAQHISKCISKRNKIVGRDLTEKLLREIAKKYKSKSEFQKNDSGAYSTANRMGILNDICKHMVSKSFSVPQLILKEIIGELYKTKNIIYNDRKTLKPYEIDIFLPDFKIGFEYNGKFWHKNSNNDIIKKKISENKNISLIIISENNRKYEQDIKQQLIDNINKLKIPTSPNEILNIKIKNPYENIYDIDDIIKITKQYYSFKKFYNENQKIYQKVLKLGLIDELTNHMCCRRKLIKMEDVLNTIKKHEYLSDLIKNDNNIYQYIKKNKLNHLIKDLKRKR